jgi:hypothetical protein
MLSDLPPVVDTIEATELERRGRGAQDSPVTAALPCLD